MRAINSRWIAAASVLALLGGAVSGARRPRYGGTLRVETSATALEPADLSMLAGAVFETLIRLDEHGQPRPGLAISWTHDTARKRWTFTPRQNVMLHNGMPWQPGELSFPDD